MKGRWARVPVQVQAQVQAQVLEQVQVPALTHSQTASLSHPAKAPCSGRLKDPLRLTKDRSAQAPVQVQVQVPARERVPAQALKLTQRALRSHPAKAPCSGRPKDPPRLMKGRPEQAPVQVQVLVPARERVPVQALKLTQTA